jgi:HEAT repeat protein
MGVERAIRLLATYHTDTPAVVGWVRPVLLLPASALTGWPAAQLEALIAHELAHIRRHDYAVNLFQTVVEVLFFYHPAVWWISRRIRREREHCCDDLAVAACGDARLYASALVELESRRASAGHLVVAASGASLKQRIHRLLVPGAVSRETGTRWAAGVFAILTVAAAFASAEAARLHARSSSEAAPGSPKESMRQRVQAQAQDTARGRPARVIRYSGAASLEERVQWAREQARSARARQYWIGYAVERDDDGVWLYYDRHVPVSSGESTMMGFMRFSGPSNDLRFQGTSLSALLGDRPQHHLAILFGFESGRLTRTHLSSYMLPVSFAGWPLMWMGDASGEESIAFIQDLFDASESNLQREDLVSMTSAHTQRDAVLPALLRWVAQDYPENVRVSAVEGLGEQRNARALAALARIARRDANAEVRREAAESVGDIGLPEAADTLIALAMQLEDEDARREAIEALGSRDERNAREALFRIARTDDSMDLRREAVESLGDLENGAGLGELLSLARSDLPSEVRREAIETLAEVESPETVVPVLERIARSDPDPDVQRQAAESLAEIDSPRALSVLLDLARNGPDTNTQISAIESLSDSHEQQTAIQALLDIAQHHSDAAMRAVAVEQLDDFQGAGIVDALLGIARQDPDPNVQRTAAEALGNAHPHDAAIAALRTLIDQHPNVQVKVQAVEALGEFDAPLVADLLAEIARRHPLARVQREAIETLSDLRGR